MAIITKSSTSGNWNATSSWVGGVVPTSADDVIFDATSAGVILNVASSVKSLDMTGFTNIFTQSANLTVSGSTNSTGQAWNVGPLVVVAGGYAFTTGIFTFAANSHSIEFKDTTTRFVPTFNGPTSFNHKIYSDVYYGIGCEAGVGNFTTQNAQPNNFDFGTFSMIYKGDVKRAPGGGGGYYVLCTQRFGNPIRNIGTYKSDNIIVDIGDGETGFIHAALQNIGFTLKSGLLKPGRTNNPNDSGVYVVKGGLSFATQVNATASIHRTGGTYSSDFNIVVGGPDFTNQRFSLNTMIWDIDQPIKYLLSFQENFTGTGAANFTNSKIVAQKPINVEYFYPTFNGGPGVPFFTPGPQTTQRVQSRFITGTGGLSASNLIINPYITTTGENPITQDAMTTTLTYQPVVCGMKFTSDAIHKIGNLFVLGSYTDFANDILPGQYTSWSNGSFTSLTASVPATIQLGNSGFGFKYDFTDINFTSNTMYAIGGVLSNTTGATTSGPSGGGGGGQTAFTFVN